MIPVDTVFLDSGNTLVGMDAALLSEVLAVHGVACAPDVLARSEAAARPALSRLIGDGGASGWLDVSTFHFRSVLERIGCEAAATLAPRVVAHLRRHVATPRLWSSVLPGVPEALATLRAAGLRLVVVSNSDGTAEQGLADSGLRGLVDHVVDSGRVGFEKPDRRIFQHALALAGAVPGRTLHVGDLYAVDVVGARGAGVHAVLLDPHGDWPDVDCERFTDLASLAAAIVAAR